MPNSKSFRTLTIGALSGVVFCVVGYGSLRANDASLLSADDAPALSAAELDQAKALYQRRCGACHSIETNRIGPKHQDVFGREAGSQPDYNYSGALVQSELIWNEQTLDQWLTDPEATIPGQKMGYRLSSAEERKAIIAYLRLQSQISSAP